MTSGDLGLRVGTPLGGQPRLVRALLLVKWAAARANGGASAIETACAALLSSLPGPDVLAVDLVQGGGQIGVNVAINELIAARAGVSTSEVNASQSTADVCGSANRIAARWAARDLVRALRDLAAAITERGQAWQGVVTAGRTCLRDASPIDLGLSFLAHASAVARRAEHLEHAASALEINLGGTVLGDGAGAPASYRERVIGELASLLGEPIARRADLRDAARHGDDLGDVLRSIEGACGTVLHVARDVRLRASGPRAGLGEIVLPELMPGSTFYRGKVNPVLEETVIQAAARALGSCHGGLEAQRLGELDLDVFDGLAGLAVLDAASVLEPALDLWTRRGIPALEVDRDRCAEHARQARPPRSWR